MKPSEQQLDPAHYPWTYDIAIRFADMDMLGHLNNVAIARLFEESRVRFQFNQYGAGMLQPDNLSQLRMIVAQSNISYLQEGDYPAPVRCGMGIAKLGHTSYTLWSVLWQSGRAMAFQECVMVVLDESGPTALLESLRERMQPWLVAQPQR